MTMIKRTVSIFITVALVTLAGVNTLVMAISDESVADIQSSEQIVDDGSDTQEVESFSSSFEVKSYAGNGMRGLVNGKAEAGRFLLPYGLALDTKDGSLLVFDTYNNVIRKVVNGAVVSIGGTRIGQDANRFPIGAYSDGSRQEALFNRPVAGKVDEDGNIYICDSANSAIRVVVSGRVYTLCGGVAGNKEGNYVDAHINNPMAIDIDQSKNIYIADTLNNCIRMLDPDGNLTTVAGIPGVQGYSDDGAAGALFRAPSGIAVSADGKVIYVADTGNHCIRKIEDGIVTTIAGFTDKRDDDNYPLGGFMNGLCTEARFNLPAGLALAKDVLVIADSGNNMIRAIVGGEVITIAGSGEPGDVDGFGAEALLSGPMGVCYGNGLLYIADTNNNKIKTITFDPQLLTGRTVQ